jgi:Ring finger domain
MLIWLLNRASASTSSGIRNTMMEPETSTPIEDATNVAICSICLEPATVLNSRVTLRLCGHEYCGNCLETWFLQQERSGLETPTCPQCREVVHDDDIFLALGRKLGVSAGHGENGNHLVNDGAPLDLDDGEEFTITLLAELGAQACPDCGLWIIKEDGCDNVMCRCGCRFCYCCGAKGTCGGGPFYNNFAMMEEERSYEWNPDTESVAVAWPLFVSIDDKDWCYYWFDDPDDYEEDDCDGSELLSLLDPEESVMCPLFSSDWPEEDEDEYGVSPLFSSDWYDEGQEDSGC